MVKFLFRMESVGVENWNNRFKIVNNYFKKELHPFVDKTNSGYSVSDFMYMLDI